MKEEKVEMVEKIVKEIPDLSRREREIISHLLTIAGLFHLRVFPKTKKFPIFGIVHEKSGEIPEKDLIAYDEKQDCYLIFPYDAVKKVKRLQNLAFYKLWTDETIKGLNEAYELVKGRKDKREISAKLDKAPMTMKKVIPRFTWEEALIGAAAHEVRHRIQQHLHIELFSFEAVQEIDDYELLVLAMLINEFIIQPLAEDKKKREFDAALIGHLAVKEWNKDKTPEEISQLIKMEPEDFAKMRD
jgi:hypothetical protein